MTHYAITILLDVPPESDAQLQTLQGVEDEVRSRLTGLGAAVQALVIGALPPSAGLSPQDLARHQYRFMGVMERAQQRQKGVLAAWLDGRTP